MSITKQKQTHRYRENKLAIAVSTEERKEGRGKMKGRVIRSTNYYMQNK